jgi:hypothetical protein
MLSRALAWHAHPTHAGVEIHLHLGRSVVTDMRSIRWTASSVYDEGCTPERTSSTPSEDVVVPMNGQEIQRL